MSLHTKVSGVWKEITTGNIFVKDSGVWKDVANIFVNVSGTWTSMIFTPGNVTYTSSGTFAVPLGTNNLLIECWGGGGSGGGGASSTNATGGSGTINLGGGAGGGAAVGSYAGGSGGSGVVILRMLTADYSGTSTGSPTVSTSGSDTILIYNASGSYTG